MKTEDWFHLVPDAVLLRRLQPRPMRRCVCCGERYERGRFRCCAPPNGMASQVWLSWTCPPPSHGGCGCCPRHCACPTKAARLGPGPLAYLAAQYAKREDPA
jgi:hypothetical protein